jgi:hypothetical protein
VGVYAAVYCGPLPKIDESTISNLTGLTYMNTASLQCNVGFLFRSTVRLLNLHCTADATWNVVVDSSDHHAQQYRGLSWDVSNVNCSRMHSVTC